MNVSQYIIITTLLVLGAENVYALTPDEKWACECMLCLSNPGGPTQYQECRPPINRLYREMAKPHFKMPTCPTADSSRDYININGDRIEVYQNGQLVNVINRSE